MFSGILVGLRGFGVLFTCASFGYFLCFVVLFSDALVSVLWVVIFVFLWVGMLLGACCFDAF